MTLPDLDISDEWVVIMERDANGNVVYNFDNDPYNILVPEGKNV